MLDKEKLLDAVTHKICPIMFEWSCPDAEHPHPHTCLKCPVQYNSEHGPVIRLCRGIAQEVAELAIKTFCKELPNFDNKEGILKRYSDEMNVYAELLEWAKDA